MSIESRNELAKQLYRDWLQQDGDIDFQAAAVITITAAHIFEKTLEQFEETLEEIKKAKEVENEEKAMVVKQMLDRVFRESFFGS